MVNRRGGGRGMGAHFGMSAGLRPVTEESRISIADQLAEFQRCQETTYTFEDDLNNHDRAIVHAECRKFGFSSKSHGKGENRKVTVYKPSGRLRANDQLVFDLPFSATSQQELEAYLRMYPAEATELESMDQSTLPTAAEGSGSQDSQPLTGAQHRGSKRRAPGSGAAGMSAQAVAAKQAAWKSRQQGAAASAMADTRATLPITANRQEILDSIAANQVVMVAGNTGCGKSTQVPQYLLEHAWEQGRGCRVMCTQPRRISAVSIAERVAAERGEAVGGDIGYTIRLESKGGPHSSLMFCTNGVLLRALTHGEGLGGITHIIVDEVHERDKFADFLLIQLREVLPRHPHLRLVLMSATMHLDLFQGYFRGCPIVEVPGFTHPVTDVYLDDVLGMVGYSHRAQGRKSGGHQKRKAPISPEAQAEVEAAIMDAFLTGSDASFQRLVEATGAAGGDDLEADAPAINVTHGVTGATALMAAAGKGRLEDVITLLSNGADAAATSRDGSTAAKWAERFGHLEISEYLEEHVEGLERLERETQSAAALSEYQASTDADEVDLQLMVALLQRLCQDSGFGLQGSNALGAILVFLPGWDEIARLKDMLEEESNSLGGRCEILPLHSMVPSADQRRVFKRSQPGERKIVLATNIAETAVTIADVVCVVNSGRQKEKSYDPYTAVATLQAAWISKASERQRRGRAGRCQPGVCYHLYSRARSDSLPEFQLPELQRCPLEELCLQVKLLEGQGFATGGSISTFLAKAPEPPMQVAVEAAVALLRRIGALDGEEETLTVLGRHLAALPLPPATAKLLLWGVLLSCLDPLLTVACASAFRDPWVLPIDSRDRSKAAAIRTGFAEQLGGHSDQLAIVAAYNGWVQACTVGRERQYAARNYVSHATMNMISGMRSQLLRELQARGLVASVQAASWRAADLGVVRSVLACGLYPLVGRLLPRQGAAAKGTRERSGASILTSKAEKAAIHLGSVNTSLTFPPQSRDGRQECPLVAFEELTRSEGRLMVRSCTAVNAHMLALVAAHAAATPPDDDGVEDVDWQPLLSLDHWMVLKVPSSGVASSLLLLRQRLAAAFAAKVQDPRMHLPPAQRAALELISRLLSLESSSGKAAPSTASRSPMGSFTPTTFDNQAPQHAAPRPQPHMPPGLQGRGPPPGGRGGPYGRAGGGRMDGRGRGGVFRGRAPSHGRGHPAPEHYEGGRHSGTGNHRRGRHPGRPF
ncbi:hypothetical protein WJX73_001801 [Symbiochloris irregularis]|uniref:Uncharacterized protein n=1 Tax=Symbiochloris irregularis TaxID=706552 RepID=A0AAW1PHH2_9CHLO